MATETIYYDPSKPLILPEGSGTYTLIASRQKEIDNMATTAAYVQGGFVGVPRVADESAVTVKVADLFDVFPELESFDQNHSEFAADIKRAAELARSEESLISLRDRFHQAAHEELATEFFEEETYTGPKLVKETGDDDDAA